MPGARGEVSQCALQQGAAPAPSLPVRRVSSRGSLRLPARGQLLLCSLRHRAEMLGSAAGHGYVGGWEGIKPNPGALQSECLWLFSLPCLCRSGITHEEMVQESKRHWQRLEQNAQKHQKVRNWHTSQWHCNTIVSLKTLFTWSWWTAR